MGKCVYTRSDTCISMLLHEREHPERLKTRSTESAEASQHFTPPDDIQIRSQSADVGNNLSYSGADQWHPSATEASAAPVHSARRVIQGTHTLRQ